MVNLQAYWRQTWALTKKNFRIVVVRNWLSTLIRALILPVLFIVLLLEIQNFSRDSSRYGFGSPSPVPSLADTIQDKKLVLVQPPGLGPDFAPVYEKITKPLDRSKLVETEDEGEITAQCYVDYHGNSPCHAAVIFYDSPLSGRVNATWNYTIRADPSQTGMPFDVFSTAGPLEQLFLPLQSAIENAMTNSTDTPETLKYTTKGDQEDVDLAVLRQFQATALYILSFVFFFSMLTLAQHVASMVATERQSGLSQLIDAMGGGAAWARVMSYVLTFNVVYLPLWIIMACLFWNLLMPTSSLAITIFWQILTGLSVTSWSIMGASFFTRSQLASIFVTLISVLLCALAAYEENLSLVPVPLRNVVALSLFFPPMNYVFFFDYLLKSEIAGSPLDLGSKLGDLPAFIPGQGKGSGWVQQTSPGFLWGFLALQIVGYLLVAVAVESLWHGNNRVRREFCASGEHEHAPLQTAGLVKHYTPSLLRRIFCFASPARTKTVKAVDGLDLASQRNQITCLLGPNGSGKTTTLDMLAGFHAPTSGKITFNSLPTQIGICPQKNVLWDNLTVHEHVVLWNQIKGNVETPEELERLLEMCDLTLKKATLAKNLSGGMKRKLQLACMFVGGSTICLMDEVTSGLDPLSRRVIWNAVLSERAHRTMVLTTHFLDESEVLSDHIVILSLGRVKCSGTPAQLKTQHGAGYRVHLPKTPGTARRLPARCAYPVAELPEKYVVTTPDSGSAARLIAAVSDPGDADVFVTGPTIEDVFLKVSEEPHMAGQGGDRHDNNNNNNDNDDDDDDDDDLLPLNDNNTTPTAHKPNYGSQHQPTPSEFGFFVRQFRALLLKRLIILRSQWWAYLFALLIPVVASHFLGDFLYGYSTPSDCDALVIRRSYDQKFTGAFYAARGGLALGPRSQGPPFEGLLDYMISTYSTYASAASSRIPKLAPTLVDSRDAMVSLMSQSPGEFSVGGVWAANDSSPLIAVPVDGYNLPLRAMAGLNLANQLRSGTHIAGHYGLLVSYTSVSAGNSMIWVTIFCLLQALYPAFFALYPTYERRSHVRALQYSNGVRPAPLLASYLTFDFLFVLVISILCTAIVAPQASFWALGYVWFVQALYGIAATLSVYLISRTARSQPGAFGISFLVLAIMYILAIIAFIMININNSGDLTAQDGAAYGLGVIFPIQNLLRAMALSLNAFIIRCRGSDMVTDPGSVYAYGGPVMLLILQIAFLFNLLLWLEGGSPLALWSAIRPGRGGQQQKHHPLPEGQYDKREASASASASGAFVVGRPDVAAETARVEASAGSEDLLRVLHASKRFAGGKVAVDNLSWGLRRNEILALLGPNGAGKTTAINMIRGDMAPTSGHIYLEGVDVHRNTRLAQKNLGVCPQFDALDMLTVEEHLLLYARCKAVPEPRAAAARVMRQCGIAAHAGKLAARLSGGNRRKLSLAIALLGDPPVLLLDEPSSAMDAASKRQLWRCLARASRGRSVLLTTHSMEEADALATRAAIVSAGRMLAVGATQDLRRRHSDEYHVHLILRSAPLSGRDEMDAVAGWARAAFGGGGGGAVTFEGQNLGGQVRFIVPANSPVPEEEEELSFAGGPVSPLSDSGSGSNSSSGEEEREQEVGEAGRRLRGEQRSFVRYLIETLEANKDRLGLECYSINTATMERVFLSVVKGASAAGEEEPVVPRRRWWRQL